MMSIRPARGLTGPLYVWSGLHRGGLQLHHNPPLERNERMSFNGMHNVRTSLIGPCNVFFSRAALDAKLSNSMLANAQIYTMKSKLSKNRIHVTNSGDTMDHLPNNKIPISLVTRIMQIKAEVKPKKEQTKPPTAAAKSQPRPPIALRVSHSESEPAISVTSRVASTALVPYASNTALRNVRRRPTAQRPNIEDLQNNSNFKETYERLRRLGLLKARMGNCHVGMTSPSGKTKFPSENLRAAIENAAAKKAKPPPKKPMEIKSKFLQNNVVLKVQHYYSSQGKDVPDELKSLTRGQSNRFPASTNSFTGLKRRRYQAYPCTSPSSTYFTRTMKKR